MELSLDILYGFIMKKVMEYGMFHNLMHVMCIIWLYHMVKLGLNKFGLNMMRLNIIGLMKWLMMPSAFKVGLESEKYFDEAPNEEERIFYDQLEESSCPL